MLGFYFARMSFIQALFFFILGTPLGVSVIAEDSGKRLISAYVAVALMDYIKLFYARYWFVFTIQGLTQTIIFHNEIQNLA